MSSQTVADPPQPLFPQLKARPGGAGDAVRRNQRARLVAAMIEACARHGYAATTARELVALAGVSTKSLYQHFGSMDGCFLATYDVTVQRGAARIASAYRAAAAAGEGAWSEGLCAAFDAFVVELLERPKASRLALVEVLAVGALAIERVERTEAIFVEMIAASLARAPGRPPLPPLIVRGLVGGIWFVSRRRLLEGRPAAVSGCGRELLAWMLAYPDPMLGELGLGAARDAWGRGPSALERLPADPRSRMLRAAVQTAARAGFGALSEGAIIAGADVSPAEFAAEFGSSGECFLAALRTLAAQAVARALRESRPAAGWAAAVCRTVRSLLHQFAADPTLARVTFVESREAGPAGSEQCAALVEAFAAMLVRHAGAAQRPSPLVAEAIVGAAWSIVRRCVVAGRAEQLPALAPYVAYLALAPAIGAGAAGEVILAEFGRGISPTESVRMSF